MIALDTETARFATGLQAPQLACVSVAWDGTTSLYGSADAGGVFRSLLEGGATFAGHHVAFDMVVACANYPDLIPDIFAAYREDRITCTEVREKLLDIQSGTLREKGYSLGAIAERRLNVALDKEGPWRLGYGALIGVPVEEWPEGARLYAIADATVCRDLYHHQAPAEVSPDEYRQARASFWLKLMSAWGITTSKAKVDALENATRAERERIARTLREAGLLRFNGTRDMAATKARVVRAYQGRDVPLTASAAPATDEVTCAHSGDSVLVDYAEFSHLTSLLGGGKGKSGIALLRQGHDPGPWHAYYSVLKETGRTGSGSDDGATGGNAQNMRRSGGIRECYVPRPGWIYIDADYGGIEACAWAQACLDLFGQSALARELNAGIDIHISIAAMLLGRPYEECKAIYRDKRHPSWGAVDQYRQVGKVANYGLPGGMGLERFVSYAESQYGVIMTLEMADRVRRTWRAARPEYEPYSRWIDAQTKRGYIMQIRSGRVRGNPGYCDGCNTIFQGLAADLAKDAGFRIAEACYAPNGGPLYGSRPVLFGHDQFLVETPDDARAHDAAKAVEQLMLDAAETWLPDIAVTAEPCLARCFSKKAAAIYGADGRLVPWDL